MADKAASNPLATVDFGDPSKLNFYGAEDADKQEYQNALAQSLAALEQRYAQPNWFKIAAGFAKPQLGGFMASLGSAAEAEGERIDQQRAAQLPIAQLRAQLAMSKIGMGQNKAVADQFKLWQENGSKPEDLMKLRDFAMATAPNAPVTAAIAKRYDSMVTERQLASADQANVIGRINTARALGRPVDPADLAKLAQYSNTPDSAPKRTEEKPEVFKPITDTNVNANYSLAGDRRVPAANVEPTEGIPTGFVPNGENGVFTKAVPLDQREYPSQAMPSLGLPSQSIVKEPPSTKVEAPKPAPPNQGLKPPPSKPQNNLTKEDENAINKILGVGERKSPFSNLRPELQPDQPAKTSNQKYPVLHPIPDTTDLDESRAAAKIAFAKDAANKTEAVFENQFKTIAPYLNPTIITPYRQSISKSLQYVTDSKTKPVAEKVFNNLGQGTLTAQILKSVQAGLQANVAGGLLGGSFSLSLPSQVWADAGLKPEQYELANKITSEFAKQVFYEASLKGLDPNQLKATEFNALAGAQPSRQLSLGAVVHMLKTKDIDTFYQHKIARTIVDELGTKVDPSEIAKFTSVYKNSPMIKKITQGWNAEKKKLD